MENKENLAPVVEAENVVQPTEEAAVEAPKIYSEAEFNEKVNEKVKEVVGRRLDRREAKIRKEYERKYGDMEYTSNVLKAGLQTDDVGEATKRLASFYADKGVNMPSKPNYSARDIETLAKADAAEIIDAGYDEVVEETDRLSKIGAENMTERDKILLRVLSSHRRNAERVRELSDIGVSEEVYNSPEFQAFASKLPKKRLSRISMISTKKLYQRKKSDPWEV